MAHAKEKPATYADIEALPPHIVGEIIYGALHTHPRPMPRHVVASSALGGELMGPFQKGAGGPGGWIFADEPELHLGPHVVVPDIAGWRRENLPSLPETAWFDVPPDWVCELLSDSTEKLDKGLKRKIYSQYVVKHLWLVDPRTKLLEVFERQDENWLLTHTFSEDEEVNTPPFTELTFSLGVLWPFDEKPDEQQT